MRKICKIGMIAGLAGSIGATLLYFRSEYEKRTLSIAKYTLHTPKLKKKRRLLFLSDLHDASFGDSNTELLEEIEFLKPDAVLIGGDFPTVKGKVDLLPSVFLCEELSSHYPVYYGNGNHELRMRKKSHMYGKMYFRYKRCLEEMGITYLSNTSADFGDDICIHGLNIEERYYTKFETPKMRTGYITNRLGVVDKEKFHILLAHSPLFLDAYADWGADLVLSGHFHGGTIRLPGGIGLMTPQFHLFSTQVVGKKVAGETTQIISAGLGTHSVNIRLNNKPQIVVIDVEST